MRKDQFEKKLVNDKMYLSVWIYFVLAGILFGIAFYGQTKNDDLKLPGYIASGVLVLVGFVLSKNYMRIRVAADELIIEKYQFGKLIMKIYDLKKIEKLKYKRRVKSNVYTTSGRIKVMGMDLTPESWKKYYYHKEIISFTYEGRFVEFGKWKQSFDGKNLYDLLKVNSFNQN